MRMTCLLFFFGEHLAPYCRGLRFNPGSKKKSCRLVIMFFVYLECEIVLIFINISSFKTFRTALILTETSHTSALKIAWNILMNLSNVIWAHKGKITDIISVHDLHITLTLIF